MTKNVFLLVLVISLLLSSCMSIDNTGQIMESIDDVVPPNGQVFAIQLRSTLWGMEQAAKGASGTAVMAKDNLVTFIWSLKDGWGFATIDTNAKEAVKNFVQVARNGNFVNVTSLRGLVAELHKEGWRIIPAAEVPIEITKALSAGGSWLSALAAGEASFLLLPGGMNITEDVLREYENLPEDL